jgi:hypothetical protein
MTAIQPGIRLEALLNEDFRMTRFETGQIVCVTSFRSLAYGRLAKVVMAGPHQVKVQFVDLPKSIGLAQQAASCFNLFESNELTLVQGVPDAAFYLRVIVVERDHDRRYVHQCLAHGQRGQCPTDVANSVAQRWCDGGVWDADEQVYRFSLHRFVLAENWHEILLADYINLRSLLKVCEITNL